MEKMIAMVERLALPDRLVAELPPGGVEALAGLLDGDVPELRLLRRQARMAHVSKILDSAWGVSVTFDTDRIPLEERLGDRRVVLDDLQLEFGIDEVCWVTCGLIVDPGAIALLDMHHLSFWAYHEKQPHGPVDDYSYEAEPRVLDL